MAKSKDIRTPTNPFTEDHLRLMNRILQACAETKEYIQGCKNCGIDVTGPEMATNEHEKIVSGLKRMFFPHASQGPS